MKLQRVRASIAYWEADDPNIDIDECEYGNLVYAHDVEPLEERVAELEAENALLKERLEKLDSVVERGKSCENCAHYDKDSDEEPCAGCGTFTHWELDFLILKVEEGK